MASNAAFIELPSTNLGGPTVTITGARKASQRLNLLAFTFGRPQRFLRVAANAYRDYLKNVQYAASGLGKGRTGVLRDAWRSEYVNRNEWSVNPGSVAYSRVHDFGLDDANQFVRGYVTNSGRKVSSYIRHMKIKERRYVRDTVTNGESRVLDALNLEMNKIVKETAVAI